MKEQTLIITTEWLKDKNACRTGCDWFKAQTETGGIVIIKKLVAENHWSWANWTIVRLMTYNQYVRYAVFAAEQVIEIFEKQYPNDKRPRNAIDAAKKCIENPSPENKAAAAAAAAAAYAYAYAAYAAAYAAAAAAYAAAAAAYADAYADAYAAAAAAAAAAVYADAMRKKIIEYGIKLLEADNA